MLPLSDKFPFEAFVGRRVESIFEGSHFVDINFQALDSDGAHVQFEGPVILRSPLGEEWRIENQQLIQGNTIFQALLSCIVQGVVKLSDSSCRFNFSQGWSLDLIGDLGGYESYHLSIENTSGHV